MPVVEMYGITGQQSSHQMGNTIRAAAEKEMGVVGHQRPSIAGRAGLGKQFGNPVKKVVPIFIIQENFPSFDSPDNDMMKDTRGIQS